MSEDAKQSLTAVVVAVVFIGGGLLAIHLTRDVELPAWGKWVWMATAVIVIVRLALAWRRRNRRR
ncbi:hypothetical protein [Phenylobacterium sp. 58.2.17]|uniref:hypothetical protein n=1 Tax=Phenylobacterium sp. 58.2.17 TaxID=2969306 RepID=UPI002264D8F7|nr:hypothetical protein [Phenylobacterium sp. 58.2.17]MCX7585909.1 hypothetical protein [Phenylobacterium sp. 58.2.17]